jgi:4-hydroxybenzoate polyprenyltransferase
VSNLPTVWTNAALGAVLSGAPSVGAVILGAAALTLLYLGGMWLNDAFDAEIDAAERSSRPIPAGEISRGAVFAGGWGLLAAGVGLAAWGGALWTALALVAAIVLYDWCHKRTVLAPVVMGASRALAVLLGAALTGGITGAAAVAGLGLLAYVAGLTYAAKGEARDRLGAAWPLAILAVPLVVALWAAWGSALGLLCWAALAAAMALSLRWLARRGPGDVPGAVSLLIAGISLHDAAWIAGAGAPGLALAAAAGFGLTLLAQRRIPGT